MSRRELQDRVSEEARRRLGRRRLLQGLASGGGAAALLAASGASRAGLADPAPEAAPDADHHRIGFRAPEHTRWYYSRARW
jgi:hypothetical protein